MYGITVYIMYIVYIETCAREMAKLALSAPVSKRRKTTVHTVCALKKKKLCLSAIGGGQLSTQSAY